jgi:hypothetical protein
MSSKTTTLTRVSKTTIPMIKDLQEMLKLRNSREVVDMAIDTLAKQHADKAFDVLVKKSGKIYAKRRRR